MAVQHDLHAHDHHAHGHDHGHGDHGHALQPPRPAPVLGAARAMPVVPAPSLMQLSVPRRLAGAALLSALIWAGVWWAMHP